MNPSTALATVLVDALIELGVRHAVLCPGSRSSALAYALAAADARAEGTGRRLRLHVRVDERSAAFVALGLAKESGVPAVVVTTSGTAVANLHPAVLEAAHAGVPLLVLSADRPHELRGTGANQTTDQVKLFGSAVRLFAEIPAPHAGPGQAQSWRNAAARAVAAARGLPAGEPGPVHLNVAFREPLVPDDDPDWPEPLDGAAGLTRVLRRRRPVDAQPLSPGPRTVLLAGDGQGRDVPELAQAYGWPLLAEPSSGARTGAAIGPYRLLLDHPRLGHGIERVVVVGRPTLSRPVSALLARSGVEIVVVTGGSTWTDAARSATLVLPGLTPPEHGPGDAEWLTAWQRAGAAAQAAVDEVLDAEAAAGRLVGPLVAREVARATAAEDALVVASSNAVRDLDLAGGPWPDGPGYPARSRTVLANRGLAGIDGTLSTATGIALARRAAGAPGLVRVLLGDLAFVHDVNGLQAGPSESRPRLQVVLLDDAGGGIFELLEPGERAGRSAADAALFERVFATPSGVDVAAVCAGYGVVHREVKDLSMLRAELAVPGSGFGVLHLRVDREGRRELSARIAARVTERVGAALR